MDSNLIKQKLDSFQKKEKKEKIDVKKFLWRPPVGTSTVRIVPSKENPKYPFKEVYFHYGISKFPMYALTNFGEKDPIVEFASSLKENGNKEDWKLSKKLEPKMRVFVPVIVRGEEELGVRLWEFGKEIYNELLSLAADEDVGDYTSITDGRDIKVETIGKEVTGNFNKSSVRVKPKTSPLTEDKNLLNKWLHEQPEILKLYEKVSYDTMKKHLIEYLTPSEETETEGTEEENQSNATYMEKELSYEKEKVSKAQKFDDLFSKNH